MRIKLPLFPKSLAGRVFALYAANLLLFVAAGLFLFYNYQFNEELESAQETASVLGEVVAQSVSDSAVIGDYDAIKRTLQQAVRDPMLGSASYIDVAGGIMTVASSAQPEGNAPAWLARRVGDRLLDLNNVIKVGGRDYGVLRLRFAPQVIAAVIWKLTSRALVISAATLLVGLALIRFSLRRWLGGLDRIRQFDWDLMTRTAQGDTGLASDAPVEIREAVDSFRRAGAALQTQRETAAVTLNAVADGVITTDDQGRILYANPAAEQMLRVDAAAMLQNDIRSVIPGFTALADGKRLDGWTSRRLDVGSGTGGATVLDTTFSTITDADGTIIGHVLACRDVTAAKRYEDRLRVELEMRQDALESLRGALKGLLPEASLGPFAASDTDLGAVSRLVADLVREREASRRELDNRIFALDQHASVSIADPTGNITYANAKFSEITGYSVEELLRSNHRITASGLHPPEFYREMWQTIASGRVWHGEIVNRHKNGSLYWVATTIVPWLDLQGRPYQYIAIRTDITAQKEVELALEAARHRELETGYAIQRAMLIGEPPEGLRAAHAASYSEASQGIDGDFFAFTTLRDDCLELLVGDVMGKGVPAALVGAAVRTAYNQVVTELLSASLGSGELPSPERVVNTLHARLTPRLIELDVFVTLALYRFDFSAGTIRYVNAGHTEGLILRADGRVAGVLGENLPLGVLEGERYVECSEPLRPGDALVVYSDGLTEARNAEGTAFGDERVRSELSGPFRLGLPPNICLQMLRRAAREFIGGGQLVDDQTVAMVAVPPRRDEKRGSTDAFDLPWEARKLEPLRTRVAAAAVALKPEMADGLVLASFEAATNVVRHVTPPFSDALLSCRIECETDKVSVEIWYLGAAFAPPAEPTPDFSGASEGGFGLYIMQRAVSRVCHESPLPGVCCTRLVQSIAEQAAA